MMIPEQIFFSSMCTEMGYMRALCSSDGLFRLVWQQHAFKLPDEVESNISRETIRQLSLYLSGKLKCFNVPLDLSAQSKALQRWLEVMMTIPYGKTVTYADYAGLWGNRRAARAAGHACQKNCLPIIIPCHRVVRNYGGFNNYSGGDTCSPRDPANIARKRCLIEMEKQNT